MVSVGESVVEPRVEKDVVLEVEETRGNSSKCVQDNENINEKTVVEDESKDAVHSLRSYFRIILQYSEAFDHFLRVIGLVAAYISGATPPLMTIVFGSSVNKFNAYGAGNSSSTELYNGISQTALYFVYLFVARFALVYVHTVCFGISGIRATRSLRQHFITPLLRQDISYLDSCSSGTITSTISNNADMVENGVSEKLGSLIQAVAMFVAAFVVAFSRQWSLTLVTATTIPVLLTGFIVTFGLGKVMFNPHSPKSYLLILVPRCKDRSQEYADIQ